MLHSAFFRIFTSSTPVQRMFKKVCHLFQENASSLPTMDLEGGASSRPCHRAPSYLLPLPAHLLARSHTHTHPYSLQRGSVGSRAKVSIVPRVTCSTGICWCPQPLLLTCGWAYCTAHLSLRAVQRMAQDLLQWLGSGAMAQADLLEGP